ncbi:MAG: UDP-N-acetylmuramoyl-tripeptide--D-alanyl-D-alanine ligase [Spirochaetaceae bacterium]|nr:UDP-N-acetylmuramoyl-tripeptide--D-alanyl-D-alanine ligase [Spirochaetaceae bacterium]
MSLFNSEMLANILGKANSGAVNEAINVSIDSRLVSRGSLFVALKGEHNDGSAFLEEAFKNGATMAITSYDSGLAGRQKELAGRYSAALFLVDNPLYALQQLAGYHIKRFPKLIKIGITGSNGKTTVKEMLAGILRRAAPTAATIGNLNSDCGLPLSCFAINSEHKYAVLEMGMNRKDEMSELAGIVKPNYAIITNIGNAHIGMLGSREAIAHEKKAIASHFNGSQTLFLPQHDSFAAFLAQNIAGRVIFYAPTLLKKFERVEDLGLDGYKLYVGGETIRIHFAGKHNLHNACLAIYVALELGLKLKDIKEGLEKVRPLDGRSQVSAGRITLLKDYYNASPESMKAAIGSITALKYARKLVFLAEMRELGDNSADLHKELASSLLKAGIDEIYLLGPNMAYLAAELKELKFFGAIHHSTSFNSLKELLLTNLKDGDLLLLKGSRYYQLERLIEPLTQQGFLRAG